MWLQPRHGAAFSGLVTLSQDRGGDRRAASFFDGGSIVVALDVLLIALYLFLTYEAGRESPAVSAPGRLRDRACV